MHGAEGEEANWANQKWCLGDQGRGTWADKNGEKGEMSGPWMGRSGSARLILWPSGVIKREWDGVLSMG